MPAIGTIIMVIGALWAIRHALNSHAYFEGRGTQFTIVFAFSFVILMWQTVTAYLERPIVAPKSYFLTKEITLGCNQPLIDALKVCVAVPAYNEDSDALEACILSLLLQTRLPQRIHVIDDGSTNSYGDLRQRMMEECRKHSVEFVWERVDNAGKRKAQAKVFSSDQTSDIFITVDSDSILDRDAINQILQPFYDEEVMSVAGVVLALNVKKNILTRFTDLWYVAGQLTDRSSLSVLGSVMVNSGPLAAYRADIVRRYLDAYTSEEFFGRRVEFSDDSMLTLYALSAGKTVQQQSAIVYTLMPENVSHHLRQYLRWMRGSTIRSWWRFKYLPLNRYAYWGHFLKWFQMLVGSAVFVLLIVSWAVYNPAKIPILFLVPIFIGYAQSLRYLLIKRDDVRFRSQLATIMLAPAAMLWSFFVLRPLRWYGMATCMKTGWGTRETVEVTLGGKQ
jgi:hyaluronan synthase